jgi:tetratricopeptide (TPR) repeat protein
MKINTTKRRQWRSWSLAVGLVGVLGWDQAANPASLSANDDFLGSVKASTNLDATSQAKIVALYEELKASGTSTADAITQCMQLAYPSYKAAHTALESDDLATALRGLAAETENQDAFLALDAAFFLGRTYLLVGQHENAVDYLEKVAHGDATKTERATEALYYLGTAQAGLLQIDEAMENLIQFLQRDSDAPERLKEGAYNELIRLDQAKKNQLADAQLRMSFSERKLGQAQPDGKTQEEQAKVVDILNTLIEEAEKKECSGNCKGGKGEKKDGENKPGQKPGQDPQGQKPGKGQSPGQSQNANGTAQKQMFDNGPISIWSQLRDRDRDPANSAVKEQLPPEYRKLIERYFREMSDGAQAPK